MDLTRRITSLVLIAALGLLGGACASDPEESADETPVTSAGEEPETSSEIQHASISIDAEAIALDGALEASPAEITFSNEGDKTAFVFIGRLNDGVTEEELLDAVKGSPDAAFGLVTAAGGVEVEAGATETLTAEFPEGIYVAANPDAFAKVAPAFFSVVAATETLDEPPAEWTIETGDFYFTLPEGITAGTYPFVISNAGTQSHEVILKKKGDKAAGFFTIAPAPGGNVWVDIELTPGEYTAICFFPDAKTGKPHFELGMKAKFTVE
jgi:hypothetical protein